MVLISSFPKNFFIIFDLLIPTSVKTLSFSSSAITIFSPTLTRLDSFTSLISNNVYSIFEL